MSRSSQRGNWNKVEFQLRRKAFERGGGGDGIESGSVSEDENLPTTGRRLADCRQSAILFYTPLHHTLRLL